MDDRQKPAARPGGRRVREMSRDSVRGSAYVGAAFRRT